MASSAKKIIMKEISSHEPGWAFCAKDFLTKLNRNDIDTALFHLEKEKKIRRIMRGIYDYPSFSVLLQKNVAPDMDQVASAIARNLHHEIQPTGNTALNYLKLSTQIPAKFVFLWDGKSQDFPIGDQVIHFKRAPKKDFLPKLKNSRLLLQALRILEKPISQETKLVLKGNFDQTEWKQILKDTVAIPNHLYRQICELAK